eukprot:Blabericola_migrator_1__3727@NODE_2115_length_3248_cov_139_331342_g1340_i0_p1_GENE_NODE_2115_length_3248_cov_139_331342_g1340_i0NODE_2115_length_3248_cov_139_331342_g1340_i0_p1_ORF_typecomplete_len394_score51_20zfC4H2/PF10146_9/3_8e02zfC4H2/PF10146_9/3_9e05Cast/PF10174_9/2_4e02Cast/PF10174_9/0_00073Vac17/PF17321_2/0_0093Vac17/PF17321_2/68DinB/PF05163_12/8_1SMC_N/PF02463_19/84SMC_N/PF02463_19/0_0076CCDC84/PF14968_6/1_5e03CCDC84/PF14968_6/0_1IL12/PF03039_14/2_6e03IL12/PF03039_14/0_092Nnf1/PF03980_
MATNKQERYFSPIHDDRRVQADENASIFQLQSLLRRERLIAENRLAAIRCRDDILAQLSSRSICCQRLAELEEKLAQESSHRKENHKETQHYMNLVTEYKDILACVQQRIRGLLDHDALGDESWGTRLATVGRSRVHKPDDIVSSLDALEHLVQKLATRQHHQQLEDQREMMRAQQDLVATQRELEKTKQHLREKEDALVAEIKEKTAVNEKLRQLEHSCAEAEKVSRRIEDDRQNDAAILESYRLRLATLENEITVHRGQVESLSAQLSNELHRNAELAQRCAVFQRLLESSSLENVSGSSNVATQGEGLEDTVMKSTPSLAIEDGETPGDTSAQDGGDKPSTDTTGGEPRTGSTSPESGVGKKRRIRNNKGTPGFVVAQSPPRRRTRRAAL